MDFTLTINLNANTEYVQWYLSDTYADFDGYTEKGDDIKFTSLVDWTAQQITDITAWYNALTVDDTAEPYYVAIYNYLPDTGGHDVFDPPIDTDYRRTLSHRLQPIVTDVYKGEVREITYYESVVVNLDQSQTGVNPVVKEGFVYTRNDDGVAESRVMTICWYLNNGTLSPTMKTRQKYYSTVQALQEGSTRRMNIMDFMQAPVVAFIVDTEGETQAEATSTMNDFMVDYDSEKTGFISTNSSAFKNKLTTEERSWLGWIDNIVNDPEAGDSIRDYMLDQLNY